MSTFYSICNTFKDEVFQHAEDLKNFAKFWGLEIFFQNRYWHDYYSTFWKCFELLCWKNKCPPQELSKKSLTVFWVSWSFTEQSLNCLPFSIVYSFEWIYNLHLGLEQSWQQAPVPAKCAICCNCHSTSSCWLFWRAWACCQLWYLTSSTFGFN